MTSDRATSANRRNAQASTGPRTRTGKARSGQNARKHGLSAADADPEMEAEIARLAELIAGEHAADAAVLEAARDVAEAQIQLQRVLAFKTALLRNGPLNPLREAEADDQFQVTVVAEPLLQLEALGRYERRALSRRKFAIRRFSELVSRAIRS